MKPVAQTHTPAREPRCSCIRVCSCIRTCKHTCLHNAYMSIQTHACMHTQSRTHACMQRHFLCKSSHRIVSANLHTGVFCSTTKLHTNAHSSVVSTFPRGAQNGNSQDHLQYNVFSCPGFRSPAAPGCEALYTQMCSVAPNGNCVLQHHLVSHRHSLQSHRSCM